MGMPAVLFAVVHKGQRPDVPADMPPDYRDLMQRCWDNDMRQRCCIDLRGPAFVHVLHTLLPSAARMAWPVHFTTSSPVFGCTATHHVTRRPGAHLLLAASAGRQWRR